VTAAVPSAAGPNGSGRRPVGVLGGGAWGTTIAHLCASNGRKTLLWLRDEPIRTEILKTRRNKKFTGDYEIASGVVPTGDLREVAKECEVIFVAIPMRGFRQVANQLGEHLSGDRILLSCTKGLEAGTSKRPSDILKEESCAKKVGVLSGPNLAMEIMKGEPCATVLASRFREVNERACDAIMGPRFRVYFSDDVLGVELSGAMKNIVALGAGITHGLGFGANSSAALITRGLAEMTRYGVHEGADALTFAGLAGIGDLICTCGSELSRNHQVGFRLGKGEKLEAILKSMVQTAEGVNTARVIWERARDLNIEMPLTHGMYRILFEGAAPLAVLADLMARKVTKEIQLV
jgi:glycerol-3-phosphate dehydrogenase (NAD(P)+)